MPLEGNRAWGRGMGLTTVAGRGKFMHHHHNTVAYTSNYLVPGVALPEGPGFRQISLSWDRRHPEAGGSFTIDPNVCGLDQFGDRTICTKIAISASDMKLTLLAEKPGQQAYTIEARPHGSTGSYSALPLRLVVIAAPGNDQPRARLLVIDADQAVERIIELQQV
jgi:hypothetical protein